MSEVQAPVDRTKVATEATENRRDSSNLQNEFEGIIGVVSWYSVCEPKEPLNGLLPLYPLILARPSTLNSAVV